MGRPVRAARQKAIERVQSKSRQDNQNVFDSGSDEGGDLTGILPSETDSDSDRYANSDDEYKISKEEKLELEREDDEEVLDSMDDEVSESELHEVRKRSRKIVKGKDAEVDVGEGDSDEDDDDDSDDGAEELVNQKSHVRSLLMNVTAGKSPLDDEEDADESQMNVQNNSSVSSIHTPGLALAAPRSAPVRKDKRTPSGTSLSVSEAVDASRARANAELDAMLDTLDVFNPRRRRKKRGSKKGSGKKGTGAIVNKLTPELQKLFLQAQEDFVKSNLGEAAAKCKLVLAGNVRAAAPWNLLSEIYELVSKYEESFHCRLVSASLDPDSTADDWYKLGLEAYKEYQMKEYAAFCFKKSLDVQPEQLSVMWDLAFCRLNMGSYKRALLDYERICELAKKDDGLLQVAYNTADTYFDYYEHVKKKPDSIIKILERCASDYIPDEDVRLSVLLVELYLMTHNYEGVDDVRCRMNVNLPTCPAHLHAKFAVALLYLERDARTKAKEQIASFLSKECASAEERRGSELDIARALLNNQLFTEAIGWYTKLLTGPPDGPMMKEDVPIHFYIGLGNHKMGNKVAAVSIWEKALRVDPADENVYIRRSLSLLLEELGHHARAQAVVSVLAPSQLRRELVLPRLEGEYRVHTQRTKPAKDALALSRATMLLHQCQELIKLEKYDELLNKHLPVINSVVRYRDRQETVGFQQLTMQMKNRYYHLMIEEHGSIIFPMKLAEWSTVILQMARLLIERGRIVDALLVAPANMTQNNDKHKFKLLSMALAFYLQESNVFMTGLKAHMKRSPQIYGPANIYSEIQRWAKDEVQVQRLLERHASRYTSVPMALMLGNSCLQSGALALALENYLMAYTLDPENELTTLLLSITLLHRVMTKNVQERHLTALDALAYFYKYYTKRKGDQEACYNLARFYHQLGLVHLAVPYYRKVIALSPLSTDPSLSVSATDLLQEAAYNLYVIHYTSGSRDLARYYLFTYNVC